MKKNKFCFLSVILCAILSIMLCFVGGCSCNDDPTPEDSNVEDDGNVEDNGDKNDWSIGGEWEF